MPTVYNKHHKKVPKDAVYVGRPGKWGNPFAIGAADADGKMIDRDRAVQLFEEAVMRPEFAEYRAQVQAELKGKDLVCWCAPARCHAEVLMRIANEGN